MITAALPPLSVYVHLPWCVRKCPYCDFNSYRISGELPERVYIDALLRDLERERMLSADRTVATVFLGGGTPSLFSGAAIGALIDGIRALVPVAPDAEITLEANPGAAEADRFAMYREAGVNRLSIGVQSLRDPQLARLGRAHDAHAARRACATATAAGFDAINIDLMYGLPDDDVDGALADLRAAIELAPDHLSWYQLTLEPATAFYRRRPVLPAESILSEIEAEGRKLLDDHGYERYEISAYARHGRQCIHNLNYWRFGDYLGIGAGAHGKLTLENGTIVRRTRPRNPRTFIATAGDEGIVVSEPVERSPEIVLEYLMNALRLIRGTRTDEFEQRTRQPRDRLVEARREAERRAWMIPDPERLAATPVGLERLNRLLLLFC